MQKISIFKAVELVQLYIEEQLAAVQTGEIAPIPYLQGPPGMGKSAILNALADQLKTKDGRSVRVLAEHPALRPLEYFSGIPLPNGHEATWTKPEVLKLKTDPSKEVLVWFWDDFHLTDNSVAKYLFELFTYRKLHRYPLPKNTVFLLAGNDSREAGRGKLLTPIINRLGIIPVTLSVEDWEKSYLVRQSLDELGVRTIKLSDKPIYPDPIVAGFLKRFPEFAMEKENPYQPFGTFRAWTYVGKLIARYKEHWGNPTFGDLKTIAQAHVSEKAASELLLYAKIYYRYNPEDIIDKDGKAQEAAVQQWLKDIENAPNQGEQLTIAYAQIFQLTDYLARQKKPTEKQLTRYYNYLKEIQRKFGDRVIGLQGIVADALRQLKYRKLDLVRQLLLLDNKMSGWLKRFIIRKVGGLD